MSSARVVWGPEPNTLRIVDAATYRRLMIGGIAALAVLIVGVATLTPSGEAPDIPDPIEEIFPLPGDIVVSQTAIEVDLPVGYELELEVDGIPIPRREIGFTAPTGRWIWQPGPTSLFAAWTGGDHTVTIRWARTEGGTIDRGEFTWTFRVV